MSNKRARTVSMDSVAVTKKSQGTETDAVSQVGQGLQVSIPPAVPHVYTNSYTVKLTYADNFLHNVSRGFNGYRLFRMNSIYDPDYTGVGHQPLGRDLWASMYDYYAVIECHYEVHIYNAADNTVTSTATGSSPQKLGSVQASFQRSTNTNDFGTGYNSVYPIAEQKNVTTKFVPPLHATTFTGTLTQGDFLVDAKDADDDQTWIAVGSNPTVARYFGYMLTSANVTQAGENYAPFSACEVYVKLDYVVQFTQVNNSYRAVPS